MKHMVKLMGLATILLSGCGANEINALNLRPLSTYAIQQDQDIPLTSSLKARLLDYCERKPTDVLPTRRAELAAITFRHPFYDELGSKTIKYWRSGDTRYVSCLNSNEQNSRVFRTDEIVAFETAAAEAPLEIDVGDTLSFIPEPNVENVVQSFSVNETHETIIPGSVFRYHTPDRGALHIVYQVYRDGEETKQLIEPGVFVFESGKNEGFAFLTQLADQRIALQMGSQEAWERTVLSSLFTGDYVAIDSLEAVFPSNSSERRLLKRVVLSDEPIGELVESTSGELSERYGTVIEVWGTVQRPGAGELTITSEQKEAMRLATYETKTKTAHLGGPNTRELFELLSRVKTTSAAPTGERRGTLALYEQLTEQRFDVWIEEGKESLQLMDVETKRVYLIDQLEFEELLDTYI
ncbi:hypothetical protein [Exiguobacterium aurantiacum]|uniref:Uncharacterized protein n=1 Tax=Exiguobacterium aurantiacum TaxID=33987 RepID=A0ABY5FP54_9BACL|nr:hypothetical protein [Exiguobacterium aurantiacum]UTT43362.1 hypothetical protein NMQ00_02345 [Exiguobacterium aurantiacum]